MILFVGIYSMFQTYSSPVTDETHCFPPDNALLVFGKLVLA